MTFSVFAAFPVFPAMLTGFMPLILMIIPMPDTSGSG